MTRRRSPLAFDRDDLTLLRDEPALLAIADAYRATQGPAPVPARPRPSRRFALTVAAIAVLALPALAFSGVFGSLFGLANGGTAVSTSNLDLGWAAILEQDGVDMGAGIRLLATRDGQAFYASRTTDGRTCLLTGPAGGTAPTVITIGTLCERNFPSPQQPLLGHYVLVLRAGDDVQSVGGLEGLAADGVATVEALDADGNVILSAPVVDNVYDARSDQFGHPAAPAAKVPAAKIVALDASGNVVYSEQIPQPASDSPLAPARGSPLAG